MILPSKHLSKERALLTLGAYILLKLSQPKTVSALWGELVSNDGKDQHSRLFLGYDGFILALDLLFLVGAIELENGLLTRKKHDS